MQRRRLNLRDTVVEALAVRIITGTYATGTALPHETSLLEEFAVSRTCLREALQLLSGKGLIVSRPRIGTVVRERIDWNFLDADMLRWRREVIPPQTYLSELFAMRRIVEPEAAALAAERASTTQIEQIRNAFEAMGGRSDHYSDDAIEGDVTFHRLILTASGNALFSGFGACIEESLRASIKLTSRPNIEAPDSRELHGEVIEAIERGDRESARRRSHQLLDATLSSLRKAGFGLE
ncbi:FadR/GntR family transcriptional regulator [Pelagibius sp. Alg239-R121]|uniref:FadR/GntR family transcriptional regulator n=1 Tax=Pelagibius sp. Alg239-R121 TaxID=2993448 RepID=UPI0024A72C7B|nr:FCD domain-containing protein [Pelagibius sp. Alg239-R121]